MSPLELISFLLGWTYFLAWSVSFYPQIILNAQRRSVHGLSVDFVLLNVLGFLCYSIFNLAHFCTDNNADIQLNDVVFSLHALFLCCVTLGQVVWFSSPCSVRTVLRNVTDTTRKAIAFLALLLVIGSVTLSTRGLLELVGSVKVLISLYKYIPQLLLNWRNQSTVGWSITNILLDFSGGLLSLAQLGVDSVRLDRNPFENPVKLAIGLQSLVFDVLFMMQHYVWFQREETVRGQERQEERTLLETESPV
ncbi:hypothetical protein HDU98_006509 [Podochytrium sp. JEL0797]|nr:hypothetical protein HDU98_006509 [Podochytrium sp. JEL0797]